MPFSLLLQGIAMGRAGRYLAVLLAYAILLAIIGKSSTYMLSWLVLPFAFVLVFPLALLISGFEYLLLLEALIFFAIAFKLDATRPNLAKWCARLGLVLCLAQITFLMSESGVGK